MAEESKQVTAFCNPCHGERNHCLLYKHDGVKKPTDKSGVQKIIWELLKCSGCEAVKVRYSIHYLEAGADHVEVSYYPPVERRNPPPWSRELPSEVQEVQLEVYSAINSGMLRLAAMGARTLLDMAFVESVGDVGTFQHKLTAMEAEEYLAAKNKHILEAAFDTGSAVAHRGHNPTLPHLEKVLDIVEHLLQEVFYFPESAKQLKQAIPPRKLIEKSEE